MAIDSQIEIIESQIREIYGRVVWTHKTHEKCAEILSTRNQAIKILQIALSALTTTGIVTFIFGENKVIGIISAILSAILFGINAYTKDHDLGELINKHSSAANDIWSIRENYLSLLIDIQSQSLDIPEIRKIRNGLQEELKTVYSGAPRTISKAYKLATNGLKHNEEMTFTSKEIDLLLPENLRKNTQHT